MIDAEDGYSAIAHSIRSQLGINVASDVVRDRAAAGFRVLQSKGGTGAVDAMTLSVLAIALNVSYRTSASC